MSAAAKQAQLRALMKQQQASAGAASSATQKVDSPLAKYTTNGDLACILCKVPVKSSVAWNAHCATPQHKQGLELLLQKKKQQKTAASAPLPADRDEDEPSAKRAKLAESESVEAHKSEASMPDIAPSGPLPSADEPEEPQISNEEILRQLRSEWEEMESSIIAPQSASNGTAEDGENMGEEADYESEDEEEQDAAVERDFDLERANAQAARRLTLLQENPNQMLAIGDEDDEEDDDGDDESSSSSDEVDINSLYDWRARKV